MEETRHKKGGLVTGIMYLIFGIIIGAVVMIGWNYYKIKTSPAAKSQAEQAKITQDLVDKVGKLILLPKGETPLILVIDDVKSLAKDNPFYKNASNGDRVLVYQKAGEAIIYSPTKNLIVNVGPVFLQNDTQTTVQKTSTPTVATTTATTTKKK